MAKDLAGPPLRLAIAIETAPIPGARAPCSPHFAAVPIYNLNYLVSALTINCVRKNFGRKDPWRDGGYLLWRTTLLWQRKIRDALLPCDLTQVQFAILAGILWLEEESSQLSQQQIADFVGIEKMMASEVIRSLERKKLLSRAQDKKDARRSRIALTSVGRERAIEALHLVSRVDEDFFGSLKSEEKTFIRHLLRLLEENGTALD